MTDDYSVPIRFFLCELFYPQLHSKNANWVISTHKTLAFWKQNIEH